MSLSRRLFGPAAATAAMAIVSPRPAEAQSTGALFQHGVASGDPLADRVIIWTRVSANTPDTIVPVEWTIAEDASFTRGVRRGMAYTHSDFDYTVKVDVDRLKPGTAYYYQFTASNVKSPIGRAKTLPIGTVNRLRFVTVSCSNYPYGYFNVYRAVANRNDLDFVLHLGDYIYEYGNGTYGDGQPLSRVPQPNREITRLADYRTRYAQYRTDPDLQEVHRQHTFMVVWDDHESTNDSWKDGAENHQPETEGDWASRRAQATQAWFEWMPVRPNFYQDGSIYRNFKFGDLLDLIMLDTRLVGRDQQVARITDPAYTSQSRTLLGMEQEGWLYSQLNASRDRRTIWRSLGQQVMMGQLVGPTGPLNLDQWDGYPAARQRLFSHLDTNRINNVFVLTGDIHSSWANELSVNPFAAFNSVRQAVEFVCPAVSSPGIDNPIQAAGFAAQIQGGNPHIRYLDLFRRGYLLVDVARDRIQSEWYHIATITQRSAVETLARAFQTPAGQVALTPATTATAPAAGVAPAAP